MVEGLQSYILPLPTDVRLIFKSLLFSLSKAHYSFVASVARSEDSKVRGHIAWKATNFGLQVAAKAVDYVVHRIEETDCPCDPFCASTNICNGTKDVIEKILSIVLMVLQKVLVSRSEE